MVLHCIVQKLLKDTGSQTQLPEIVIQDVWGEVHDSTWLNKHQVVSSAATVSKVTLRGKAPKAHKS